MELLVGHSGSIERSAAGEEKGQGVEVGVGRGSLASAAFENTPTYWRMLSTHPEVYTYGELLRAFYSISPCNFPYLKKPTQRPYRLKTWNKTKTVEKREHVGIQLFLCYCCPSFFIAKTAVEKVIELVGGPRLLVCERKFSEGCGEREKKDVQRISQLSSKDGHYKS